MEVDHAVALAGWRIAGVIMVVSRIRSVVSWALFMGIIWY